MNRAQVKTLRDCLDTLNAVVNTPAPKKYKEWLVYKDTYAVASALTHLLEADQESNGWIELSPREVDQDEEEDE